MNVASRARAFAGRVPDRFNAAAPVARVVLVITTGMLLGAFYHIYVYPSIFHGDSAALQLLATAIIDDKSLLPRDFYYGNSFIIWRSSPFIASALIAGLTGYNAFVAGSTLGVAFWFLITYLLLSLYTSNNARAVCFAALLFIPIGYWDIDYMLGQQSHLSNFGLSLAIVMLGYACVMTPRRKYALWLVVAVVAMSTESPVKALLVIVPLVGALGIFFRGKRGLFVVVVVCSAFGVGAAVNWLLLRTHPLSPEVGLGHSTRYSFRSASQIIDGLLTNSKDTVDNVSILKVFASKPIQGGQAIVYAVALMWLVYFAWTSLLEMQEAYRRVTGALTQLPPSPPSPHIFLNVATAVYMIVGVLTAACLNPNGGRHYYFGIVCLKLLCFERTYRILTQFVGSRLVAALALVLWLVSISSVTALYAITGPSADKVNPPNTSRAIAALSEAMVRYNTRRVYGGDFWKMLPINVYIPNARSTELVSGNGWPIVRHWFSRPSSACERGVVLYYLDENNAFDKVIASMAAAAGSRLVTAVDGKQIWVGRPVWLIDRPC